jgi:FkbM family methyltransferase
MGRSLWALRSLCPSPLAHARLMLIYLRLLVAGRHGRPITTPRRLRLCLNGGERDWWVADAGEVGALWEVFIAGQYADWLPSDARLVIDVGANVGTATAWFRQQFPQARVIAVEPDPAAAERLARNVGHDSNVEIVRVALSDHDGRVRFAQGQWTMRGHVVEDEVESTFEVEALTLSALRSRFAPGADVDLIKLDTEGSEWKILRDSLAGVGAVTMEIHEPTPDGRKPDVVLGDVCRREGFQLRPGSARTIRWLVRT